MKTFAALAILLIQSSFAGTPSQAFAAFEKAAKEKNFESAWKLTVRFEGLPDHITEEQKKDIRRLIEITNNGWSFDILEEKTEGDCAALVADESMKNGKPAFDIDPIYLIKQDGEWKIFSDLTQWDSAKQFAKDKVDTLTKLEVWFKARKAELRKKHNN